MTRTVPRTRHIGLSFGQIGSLSDGLGEYSSQIALQMAAQAPALREQHGIELHLHLPQAWHGRFGEAVHDIARQRLHRYLHVEPIRFDIWHSLNQLSKLRPPLGSRQRLMTVHDLNQVYAEDTQSVQKMLRQLRDRLTSYDQIVTLTHHVQRDIHLHLGWQKPVHVIPNGVRDLSTAQREPVPELTGPSFLLHLSRLTHSKNPQALLDLAAHWPQQRLVLAGAGPSQAAELREAITRRSLHNVVLLGHISDAQKAWLYASCLGFVFPSLTEGFGLPPLEAMCFGKPVFVARRTCLPEVIGPQGAYFDSFEPAAMRACIESELPRLQLARAQIRAHASRYTWEQAAQAYLALYLQLMGLGGA